VTGNGKSGGSGTPLGGFNINAATALTFTNNTVAENYAKTGAAPGVICSNSSEALTNCILWGNNLGVGTQVNTCTITYSDVQGGLAGTGNIDIDPLFTGTYAPAATACFNAGQSTAGLGVIDITNGPRLKGTKVDLGAFEVQ